jgi:uncharacterized membrane protein
MTNIKKESRGRRTIRKVRKTSTAVQKKTITLILGGFGLVAALAWNEAIKSLFETLFKNKGSLIGKFTYAAIVTMIVVIVSMQMQKLSRKDKK